MSFQLQNKLSGYNVSFGTDLTGLLGVTVGVIAGQYISYHVNFANSQYAGALTATVIGLLIVILFPNPGIINGIGLGIGGYGIYKIINIASNGAV